MNPIEIPIQHPAAFWVVGFVVTLYHAVRAWFGKGQAVADENAKRAVFDADKKGPIPRWQRVFIHQVHDALFHVVCGLVGFASAHGFALLFGQIAVRREVTAGTGIFMVFLAVFAVGGMAGVLPPMLLLGRWPKLPGQSN